MADTDSKVRCHRCVIDARKGKHVQRSAAQLRAPATHVPIKWPGINTHRVHA